MNCPSCGTALSEGARFCEACGAQVGAPVDTPASGPALSLTDPIGDAPISAPTRKPLAALPDPPAPGRRPCADCGGEVGPDLYCLECGTKAPSERDHFEEHPASWVAGVCDKAVKKARNEDAMALLAGGQPGSRAVLIVMDGVSNSIDSDVASLAGARAAREVLRMPLPAGMGTPDSRDAAVRKVLADAAAAANTAIVAVTDPDSPNPASATFTVAVLEGQRITWGNIGDSRSYWLPESGTPVQRTVDDEGAQAQMATGVAREVAENGPQAHAITKWLGRDSEDFVPTVGSMEVTEPGWLLTCSDGLWNYASEPEQLAARVRAAGTSDAAALALALVAFANGAGGHDNITAALARVDLGTPGPPAPPPPPTITDDLGQNAPHSANGAPPAPPSGGEPSNG